MMEANGRKAGKKRCRVGKPAGWRDLRVPGNVAVFQRPAACWLFYSDGAAWRHWGRSVGGWESQPWVEVRSDEF
jgi:hypothetical protein